MLSAGRVGTRQLRDGAVTPAKLGFASGWGDASSAGARNISATGFPSHACSTKCGPPHAQTLLSRTFTFRRRETIVLRARADLTDNDSQSAQSYFGATVVGVGSVTTCHAENVLQPGTAQTVSCFGVVVIPRPGRYVFAVTGEATGLVDTAVDADAGGVSLLWWTAPPRQ